MDIYIYITALQSITYKMHFRSSNCMSNKVSEKVQLHSQFLSFVSLLLSEENGSVFDVSYLHITTNVFPAVHTSTKYYTYRALRMQSYACLMHTFD